MKTILVVEDDPMQAILYEEELHDEGYCVLRAENGREALDMITQHEPDCVVLDINMPVMDGLDALGKMLERNPKLPIVINTAFSAYKDSFMSWSADAYVVKSSDLTELKTRIKETLNKRLKECSPCSLS
jgi:DNA-binding response OmpR family regulator